MILGIDPGLENTGWAVVGENSKILNSKSQYNESNESEFVLVDCGVVLTKSKEKSADRLGLIYEEMDKIIKKYKIEKMAMESLFFAKNAKSALKVAEAIGVLKVCGQRNGIEVSEFTPLQVKMALVGYGRAEKEQVETMVRSCLNLEEPISPSHASDAVAVALTEMFTMYI